MKFLGIDFGIKRVGLAVSNPAETLSFPKKCIYRTERDKFFAELLETIETEKIEAIVLGLPLHVDNTECLSTKQVYNFLASLKRRTSLPIYLMQETLSSFEAEQDLYAAQVSGKKQHKNKGMLDCQSATRILQSFLDLDKTLRHLS